MQCSWQLKGIQVPQAGQGQLCCDLKLPTGHLSMLLLGQGLCTSPFLNIAWLSPPLFSTACHLPICPGALHHTPGAPVTRQEARASESKVCSANAAGLEARAGLSPRKPSREPTGLQARMDQEWMVRDALPRLAWVLWRGHTAKWLKH